MSAPSVSSTHGASAGNPSLSSQTTALISWQPGWRELDLVIGLAVDAAGTQTLLDPAGFATLPRAGVQLADVAVVASAAGDRIFAGVGSWIDGAGGDDELFNSDSQGSNLLVGGLGADRFFLRPVHDRIIGGELFSGAAAFGLSPFTALVDRERDTFLIDSSDPGSSGPLQILDFEPGVDVLLVDGVAPGGDWALTRQQLQGLNVAINAAPQLSAAPITISVRPGDVQTLDLSPFASDADGDSLQLLKLTGPGWITTAGTTLVLAAPGNLSADQLAAADLELAFSDGQALATVRPALSLAEPLPLLSITALNADRPEGNGGTTPFTFTVIRSGDTSGSSTAAWSVAGSGSSPANAADFSGGVLPSGTVTFTPGQTTQTLTINVAADSAPEADEGFTVTLSTPNGARLDPAASGASGLIRNDDATPLPPPALRITASNADRPEGNGGTTPFTFTVSRSGDRSGVSTAQWTVSSTGRDRVDGRDFAGNRLPSGTVRFLPGESTRTISVNVRGDLLQEPDERFAVSLGNPIGATLNQAMATGTIRNDDLIGTAGADRIRGGRRPEFLDGRGGQDTLTGGPGPDLFGFRHRESAITAPDRITDFRFGEDRISILSSGGRALPLPRSFSRAADNGTATTLEELAAAVFADADGRRGGNQPLGRSAAALVSATNRPIRGTYLLINDNNPRLNARNDLLINLTGAAGRLPGLGSIAVETVFG
jgi:Ca2+-binding RTX toxin-like protein